MRVCFDFRWLVSEQQKSREYSTSLLYLFVLGESWDAVELSSIRELRFQVGNSWPINLPLDPIEFAVCFTRNLNLIANSPMILAVLPFQIEEQ